MKRILVSACALAILAAPAQSQLSRDSSTAPRELIAVWIGLPGVDVESGFVPKIHEMERAVRIEAAATKRTFIFRGVSLAPEVEDGVRHLAQVAHFDEICVGGNWTNSCLVRYLGSEIGRERKSSAVPQLILLERQAGLTNGTSLTVSPERELRRFIGLGEIGDWIKAGSPLPKP